MSRSTLEDFEQINKLGSGSFGTVWKVRRHEDGGVYVIKTVRIVELTLAEQKGAINEVKILSVLDSPFVVKYYDSFIDTDSLHIVMEYCNHGDLQSLIKKAKSKNVKSLRESVVWNIGLQVILGLHYLHNQKILHRDLKSANVFLKRPMSSSESSKSFDVKIGDLGVAKLLETSTAFAQTIVGTPYYLSPELCSDQPYRDKSDCWALGVLLYECCTLKHPFEARNQCALILKIIQEAPTQVPSGLISRELETLIIWLLEKEPTKRPTIREILNESFVRDKLMENRLSLDQHAPVSKFDVPADLVDCPLTFFLAPSVAGRKETEIEPDANIREAERVLESASIGGGVWRSGQQSVLPKPLPNIVRPPLRPTGAKELSSATTGHISRPVLKAPIPVVSSSNGSGLVNSSSSSSLDKVRGDRVRGPSGARIPSMKARERYQVKAPIAAAKDSSSEFDETVVRAIEVKGSFEKFVSLEPDPSLDYTNLARIAESKNENSTSVEYEGKADLRRDSKDGKDDDEEYQDYEEDFHSDSNDEDAEYYGDHLNSEEEDGIVIGDLDCCPDQEATTRLLQTLSKKATVTSIDSGDSVETVIDHDALVTALEQLVLEARERSISSLGEELFFRIYKLCSEFMEFDNAGSSAAKNAKLLKDLEVVLCEQLQGSVEVACDAVFGVKVLLALEDKLQQAISEK